MAQIKCPNDNKYQDLKRCPWMTNIGGSLTSNYIKGIEKIKIAWISV